MRILTSILIGCSLIVLNVLSFNALAKVQKLDKIIAVVNDGIITQSQLDNEVHTISQQLEKSNQSLPDKEDFKKQVLDKLIIDELQLQYAKNTGIYIDDATLDRMVADLAKQNNMNLAQLREALAEEDIDFRQFRENLRRQQMMSSLHQRDVLNAVSVTPQEVDQFLKTHEGQSIQGLEYKVSHILIALPEAPSPDEIQAAQAKASALLKELKAGKDFAKVALAESSGQQALSGGNLGWRALPELPTIFTEDVPSMKPGNVAGPIRSPSGFHLIKLVDKRIPNNQEHSIQKTHVRHILIKTNALLSDNEAKLRLEDLKREIAQGKDFTVLAKTYSEDLGTVNQGGDLGWVTPEQLVPAFSQTMNDTPKGEISEPFKSTFGWHILQVLDRKEELDTENILKQNAENMIRNRKAEEKLESWLRQMRDEAYIQVYLDHEQPNA